MQHSKDIENSTQVRDALERQRAQIARDLHDTVGSALVSLKLDLSWIERRSEPAIAERARHAQQQIALLLSQSHSVIRDLRSDLFSSDFRDTLEAFLNQTEQQSELTIRFDCNQDKLELPDKIASTVYHTLQEATTNVIRHAGASDVLVSLLVHHDSLSLEISDDGIGMPDPDTSVRSRFGIAGMKERAALVSGWLEISSISGSGTSVLLHIPFDADYVDAWEIAGMREDLRLRTVPNHTVIGQD